MRRLYHQPFCPFCRAVRLLLSEKSLQHDLKEENIWDPEPEFTDISPLRTVPVLIDPSGEKGDAVVLTSAYAIIEYLEEGDAAPTLLPGSRIERAEARRLTAWFNERFNSEVTQNLIFEKIEKRFAGLGGPDMNLVRLGRENIDYHMEYISMLVDERRWLAGDDFSLADITAAAHLSSIDYVGDVPWTQFPAVKDWYVRIKSRPSFRSLLADRIAGMPPPRHYTDLDF